MTDHEEDLQRLRGFRLIDDTFMRVFFREHTELAQYVLRILTGINDLVLDEGEPQRDLKRLVGARGLCLDYYGEDTLGRHYNLEIQRDDSGATAKRARYHAGALDVDFLNAGDEFEKLPTTYVIFLTEHDIWGEGKALYPVEKKIGNVVYDDGQHILYANASFKGTGLIGELMHDFMCIDPDDMYSKELAARARYLKSNPEGVKLMCQVMEDMRVEVEQRTEFRTRLESIKAVMEGLTYTAQQAMDLLKIPEADQPKYLAKI